MSEKSVELMAHLYRRAGFGATADELGTYAARGYDTCVEDLLDDAPSEWMGDDIIRRFHDDQSGMMGPFGPASTWLYRMATTNSPLREKMALFWHGVFATGFAKVVQGKVLSDQIEMFRANGMGGFNNLLVELSRDPAMIYWLDNSDNHGGAINENYGRELLELFSMGVGNYTEKDIKECARAFTGWTITNYDYMAMKAQRDSVWPYGRNAWHFEYRPEDHDDGVKEFLDRKGRFNGEDIVEIICEQPATARFISRHLYSFFVADEAPVTQWPYTPPRDPEAIEVLTQAYFDSHYDLRAMLRALFTSDFFRSESCWFEKVKSPSEFTAGVLRLTGELQRPDRAIHEHTLRMGYMGQDLLNPPSVEGWHGGAEWIDTGTLVQRLNFAAEHLGDLANPGVKSMVARIESEKGAIASPENLVESCLEQLGSISVSDHTRASLVEFASKFPGPTATDTAGPDSTEQVISQLLELGAATADFQRC